MKHHIKLVYFNESAVLLNNHQPKSTMRSTFELGSMLKIKLLEKPLRKFMHLVKWI